MTISATAEAYVASDVYVHYTFDDTSGTAFTDAGPTGTDATFYRPLRVNELPGIDISNVTNAAGGIGLGVQSIGGVDHEVLANVPSSANLPGTGDSFAVSCWLSVDDWGGTYGMFATYNLNGLEWNISMHNSSATDGVLISTSDADVGAGGTAQWTANCVSAGANLTPGTYNHFVMQFEGSSGITNVYINGTAVADATDETAFWGNEREGFYLGARELDARGYTVPNSNPLMKDFAIIDGVVDTTDVSSLMTLGAGSLGTRRLAHYAMDETSGTQLTDSSANANHATLLGYQLYNAMGTIAGSEAVSFGDF